MDIFNGFVGCYHTGIGYVPAVDADSFIEGYQMGGGIQSGPVPGSFQDRSDARGNGTLSVCLLYTSDAADDN